MERKTCSVCNNVKFLTEFPIGRGQCNDCRKAYYREYDKKRRGKKIKYNHEYYQNNKNKIISQSTNYYYENQKEIISKRRLYRQTNKEQVNFANRKYNNKKRKTDPSFKLREFVSSSIGNSLKKKSSKKEKSCLNFLEFTINELREHLEKQFEPWMNWNNWGRYNLSTWNDNDSFTWTWQIDHIIPHSSFKYTSMEDEEFKKCWALSNLRPFSAKENILKGAKII